MHGIIFFSLISLQFFTNTLCDALGGEYLSFLFVLTTGNVSRDGMGSAADGQLVRLIPSRVIITFVRLRNLIAFARHMERSL